jgi:hypothetical protein
VSQSLPRAAAIAVWAGAWLRGDASADEVVTAAGEGVQVLLGVPGADGPTPLLHALGALRRAGATGFAAALPAPGDPVGLAGPPAFNRAALDAGEAVLVEGANLGLVPTRVGGAIEWHCSAVAPPPWVDLVEAATRLRKTLLEVTARLVDLDVAAWAPEIPDALMNLRRADPVHLPRSVDERRRATIEQAVLCRGIARLGRSVTTGTISSYESSARADALASLDAVARRALVAACR